MAKYIIEFEDEPCMREDGVDYYTCKSARWYKPGETVINRLTPYTAPDREAIENEVWDFVSKLVWSFGDKEILGMGIAHAVRDMTYQEAKAKYEEWKNQKEEIRVGDEVEISGTIGIVTRVPYLDEERVHYIAKSGTVYCNNAYAEIKKTGRHFDGVEELLKKMGEEK